jgi:hypothetical protein
MRLLTPMLLLPLLLAPARAALAAEQAGVSAAVRGEVALSRTSVVGHQVVSGEPILLQDAIRSGTRSGMQILLLDQTVFTIGPESELVVDEFVYDPQTNAGKLGAEITKGVFRFVSGKIAHEKPEDMSVKLPAGTLGVRGTMVAGRVDDVKKSSRLVLLGEGGDNDLDAPAGAFDACNAGLCVRVSRPGYGTVIEGPDAPPVQPFRFPRAEIDALTGAVSDPEGWLETAQKGGTTPPVGAGPPGTSGEAGGDARSPTDVSGIRSGGSGRTSELVLARLRTLDRLDQATDTAAQFATPTVSVNGQAVQLPTSCSDINTCLGAGAYTPPTVSADITTFDQLSTLAASGLQQAAYQQTGLPLIDTNGKPDGSYDFSLQIFLGQRSANLAFSNISSSILGLSAAALSQSTSYADYPVGLNVPTAFAATATVSAPTGPCSAGCAATGAAELVNGNGRIADSAVQVLAITAPATPSGPVIGTVSANTQPIPRP